MTLKITVRRKASNGLLSSPLFEQTLENLVSIGSDASANLRLDGNDIAAEQAVIINEGTQLLLINRQDGTFVNNELLGREARFPLSANDEITIGYYVISFYDDANNNQVNDDFQVRENYTNENFASDSAFNEDAPTQNAPEKTILSTDDNRKDAIIEEDAAQNVLTPDAASSSSSSSALNPPPPPPPNKSLAKSSSSFAAILDSLRTDEDSFYFLIKGGKQSGERISVETAEIPLGWREDGETIGIIAPEIAMLCAVVRKDWGGVMIQTQAENAIEVNGEIVPTTRRLRDGDRLVLLRLSPPLTEDGKAMTPLDKNQAGEKNQPLIKNESFNKEDLPQLIFHEPASLLVLDSLLPQPLPQPVVATNETANATTSAGVLAATPPNQVSTVISEADKNFGSAIPVKVAAAAARRRSPISVFSPFGIGLFAAGTLFATLILFLLLHVFIG